jgi:transposase
VEDINDEPLHLERVAALDIGKATLEACVRVPGQAGPHRRAQEVRSFGTTKKEILLLAAWLRDCQVAKVVMEATSDYWKAPVRHEALFDREGMKGPLLWAVAAA